MKKGSSRWVDMHFTGGVGYLAFTAFAGTSTTNRPLHSNAVVLILPSLPPSLQASTGLSLRATAGLRLLPGSKADDILAAVRTYLATFPFKVKAGACLSRGVAGWGRWKGLRCRCGGGGRCLAELGAFSFFFAAVVCFC